MNSLKGKTTRALILSAVLCALTLLASVFMCVSPDTAYADASTNTFDVLFPSDSYLQAERPTLIAANDERIAVFDEAAMLLYCVNNDGTLLKCTLSGMSSSPDNLFLLKDAAFLVCGDETYVIDFASPSPSPARVTLSSPENASYYSGDGEYIYAKSAFGEISAFEFSEGALKQAYKNDIKLASLTGNFAVAGYANTVYAFHSDYSIPIFSVINLNDGTEISRSTASNEYLRASAASSTLFASDKTTLYALSKETGEVLFDTGLSPISFAAYGDKLFVISEENRMEIYSVNQNAITLLSSIGMTGSDAEHLNSPSDVIVSGGSVIAADAGNNRLLEFNPQGTVKQTLLPYSPKASAIGGGNLYAAGEHNVSVIASDGTARHFAFTQTVLDVTYSDRLYVLCGDGIYTLFAGELIKISDATGARLASAEDGKYVYLLSDTDVKMIDGNGNTAITLPLAQTPSDIAADYAGNVFLLFGDKIVKYENTLSALTQTKIYPVTSSEISVTPNSFCFDGSGKMLFTADESFIGEIQVESVTKQTYTAPDAPEIPNDAAQGFYWLKPGKTPYLRGLSGRTEDFIILTENSSILAFPSVFAAPGTCLALYNGSKVKITLADFDEVTPAAINAEYVAKESCALYYYPGSAPSGISLSAGEHVTAADNAAGFDNGRWLRISIDGKFYFAPIKLFSPVIAEKPEISKIYGKIKAERVGETVKIYSSADTSSEEICQVVDGKKVEILQTLENFYFVRFGETTGYVLKENVALNGLTTVQIIAITVSAAVLLAGGVVFAAVYQAKKKSEKKS